MKASVISKNEEKLVLDLKDIKPEIANLLRRTIITQVPVLAIEDVFFTKNSSALFDETIAHRLGLIPLKTDLKSYNLPEDCKCKGKGCAKCQVKIKLKDTSINTNEV